MAAKLHAEALWRLGFTGGGVRVAVFDTGLGSQRGALRNVEETTNWTDEEDGGDLVGHGTFVAGVISADGSGGSQGCRGLAPDATLHVYKVFNTKQVSYTSWFLDAFNYAMHRKVHIINLSIGGPDSADRPFMSKVDEAAAANLLVVSGIGNSGPLWGTLMNPADQPDVIGVGGVDHDERLADFSSRGMTSWELPDGYGRVKPDVLTYGSHVQGLSLQGGCRSLSGTSVACPVVAGAAALLASSLPASVRWSILNPASMKQVLTSTARRIEGRSAYEQGAGVMDLLGSAQALSEYVPHVSVLPPQLDFTPCYADFTTEPAEGGAGGGGTDGYLWPHCSQPLYAGAVPLLVNLTILNGIAVSSYFSKPPAFVPASSADDKLLRLTFEFAPSLWPWGGTLGVALEVNAAASGYEGIVRGAIVLEVASETAASDAHPAVVRVPLAVRVVPPPPRKRRLLVDQWHSLAYPPAYLPRDNLAVTDEMLDWNGDHMHTNFRELFMGLRSRGYFVETLGCSLLNFNASSYAALLLIDSEDDFAPAEVTKLAHDVVHGGLSIVVLAEWYSTPVMKALEFYDDNTHSRWVPITGGGNVPAINELLEPFGVAFSDQARMQPQPLDISRQSRQKSASSRLVGCARAPLPPIRPSLPHDVHPATRNHENRRFAGVPRATLDRPPRRASCVGCLNRRLPRWRLPRARVFPSRRGDEDSWHAPHDAYASQRADTRPPAATRCWLWPSGCYG